MIRAFNIHATYTQHIYIHQTCPIYYTLAFYTVATKRIVMHKIFFYYFQQQYFQAVIINKSQYILTIVYKHTKTLCISLINWYNIYLLCTNITIYIHYIHPYFMTQVPDSRLIRRHVTKCLYKNRWQYWEGRFIHNIYYSVYVLAVHVHSKSAHMVYQTNKTM